METTTPDRVEQILDAVRKITEGKGSNIFLFTDERSFAASDPLDVRWISGKGEHVRLVD